MKKFRKLAAAAFMATTMGSLLTSTTANAGQDAYIGEISLVGFTFCPRATAEANGQLLAINSNQALFSLYGCTYGGDCRTTFGLPDLRGRAPVHLGAGAGLPPVQLGERGGSIQFTLSQAQMPQHNHPLIAQDEDANTVEPGGAFLAKPTAGAYNTTVADNKPMASRAIGLTGGSQPVFKRSPYLGLRYCVVTQGIFPSRN